MTALPERIAARLKREATKREPLVAAARQHPRAQQLRRDLERVRVQVRLTKTKSADALLNDLVAEALAAAPARVTPTKITGSPVLAAVVQHDVAQLRPEGEERPIKVAVVAPRSVPYVEGGAERHWASLVAGLTEAGMAAELIAIDSPEGNLTEVLESYRRFLRLDLSAFDIVISGKYPSWMVRHPRHIRHLNHPLRGLYERYPAHLPPADMAQRDEVAARLDDLGAEELIEWALGQAEGEPFPGPFAQAVVQGLDAEAARHLAAHAAVSDHVARRPGYLPLGAEVSIIAPLTDLPPASGTPLLAPLGAPIGQHFFAHGRQTTVKRLDLTIAGFAAAKRTNSELRIAGTGPEHDRLRQLAAATPGVTMLGHCSDEELLHHLRTAIAVIATPEDEDFGLIAAEALAAGRPVIATTDSGGVAEQIEHEVNGLVARPTPRSLGRAIGRLADHPKLADRLGRAGADELATRSWQPMVRLVRQVHTTTRPDTATPIPARKRILILSTFPAEPVRGGGARRVRSVASELQSPFDVVVMALTNRAGPNIIERRVLDDGVRQIVVGRSKAHLVADSQMAALAGLPVDDIGCSVLHGATTGWADTLEVELGLADAVVLAHPFLVTSLPGHLDIPIVYDGHNVEADLKNQLLTGRRGGARFREWTRVAERQAVDVASVVCATSAADGARLHQLYGGPCPIIVANGVSASLLGHATAEEPTSEEPTSEERSIARRSLLADLGLRDDDGRPIVLFVASNHPPNHHAADHLATVAADRPDLIIVLAGAHSEQTRRHVHNYGRFSEATHRRLLLAADIAVNPVPTGSGTNLKLIEALAAGLPVVSSKVGARGLSEADRVLSLVDSDGLAAAIDRTLSDPDTPARTAAGRILAQDHRWDRTTAELKAVLGEMVGVPWQS